MITARCNTNSKEHIIFKNNIHCATMKNYNLMLKPNFIFTIEEICEILDCTNNN